MPDCWLIVDSFDLISISLIDWMSSIKLTEMNQSNWNQQQSIRHDSCKPKQQCGHSFSFLIPLIDFMPFANLFSLCLLIQFRISLIHSIRNFLVCLPLHLNSLFQQLIPQIKTWLIWRNWIGISRKQPTN